MRPHLLASLGMVLLTPMAHAGAGDIDLGAYTGVVVPGSEHELYSPYTSRFKALGPAPALGVRGGVRLLTILGAEGEVHAAFSGTADAGSALLYAFRVQGVVAPELDLPADLEPFLTAGIGDIGISSSTDVLGRDLDWAAHAGVGTLVPLGGSLGLRLDVRYLFADRNLQLGTPGGHTEVLLGLNHRIASKADSDGDGVADAVDQCRQDAETDNGYLDDDGCPDDLAVVALQVLDADGVPVGDVQISLDGVEIGRTDADGRIRSDALVPGGTVTISASHFHMASVAEQTLTLGEGDNDLSLQTDWLPGRVRVVTRGSDGPITDAAASFLGPKDVDTDIVEDGDTVFFLAPGTWSIIVAAESFGTERRDLDIGPDEDSLVVIEVEMDPAKVEVTREELVILEQVLFEVNSANIDAVSMDLLQEVANNIVVHGGIRKMEIQGHTDSTGSSADNKRLSQQRVESVQNELIARGVDPAILVAVGYGEDRSIASNDTEEGRAKNRRVQFVILEQDLVVEPESP